MLLRDYSCDTLAKNMDAFCSCLKSLHGVKQKSFGLIPLTEEISKQPSIDSVVWFWVVILIKIYNEKELKKSLEPGVVGTPSIPALGLQRLVGL